MHALVAARLGEMELAARYFQETAATDLADASHSSAGGVHIAALGGLWQVAVVGFAGLSLGADGLGLEPQMPPYWRASGFRVHWRGRRLRVHIDQGTRSVAATLEEGEPMTLAVSGTALTLRAGETRRTGLPAGAAAN